MGLPALSPDPIFDALGNPVRRHLIQRLADGPLAVGELAEALPISRPAVSRHLKVLEEAHLVRHHAEGSKNVFELDTAGFGAARQWLDRFWDDALIRLKLVAENLPERPPGDPGDGDPR